MEMKISASRIRSATERDYQALAELWEASVRSTHHFLSEEDILFYKPLVGDVYFPAVELHVVENPAGRPAGFVGVSDELIEMLFVHPDEHGKGYGSALLRFAVEERGLRRVDVNEQNGKALSFYLHRGFEVTGRDETDAQGKPFPILHMKVREL